MRPIAVSWEIALRLYLELHERRLTEEEGGLKGSKEGKQRAEVRRRRRRRVEGRVNKNKEQLMSGE